MPPLLQLQKLLGKGDGGWEKSVFASFFGWPEDRETMETIHFGASYSMSNKLLLVARRILTMGLENVFKVGRVKFEIHCHHLPLWRKYAPEVKAAKGLKWGRAKATPYQPCLNHPYDRLSEYMCWLFFFFFLSQRNRSSQCVTFCFLNGQ